MKVYNGLIDEVQFDNGKVRETVINEVKVIKVEDLLKYLNDSVTKIMPISTVVKINRLIKELEQNKKKTKGNTEKRNDN